MYRSVSRLKRVLYQIPRLATAIYILSAMGIVWAGLTDNVQSADLAVVFGNTVEPNGRPSARLQARLDTALALYQQHQFPAILVSGGLGQEGHDEAIVMQAYLIAHGVPPAQIYVDSAGTTTYQTALHTARLMQEHGWHRACVISQYFHIARARLALERAGIAPVYAAHAPFLELRDLYSIAREVPAFYAYFFRSYDY